MRRKKKMQKISTCATLGLDLFYCIVTRNKASPFLHKYLFFALFFKNFQNFEKNYIFQNFDLFICEVISNSSTIFSKNLKVFMRV